jgi:uroporphyrinogen-III synthase
MIAALPLAGRRIVVTRPAAQAHGLLSLIRAAGGEALACPTLEIVELADTAPFFAVADRLGQFDLAIFVSRNAVRRALALLGSRGLPPRLALATVGKGSREELEAAGYRGALAPTGRPDSEALLALPALRNVAGRHIVIFRGDGGRALLGDELAKRGALVEYAACYRRALPAAGAAPLLAAWVQGPVHAIAISSGEGLSNLVQLLGAGATGRFGDTPLFVPHERVSEQAARLGARRVQVAGPGDAEMTAALVAYFAGAG